MSSTITPDVVFVSGPTYYNGTKDLLVPFTYSNGKLDTPLASGYNGNIGNTIPFGNAGASVRLLGGNSLVTSIGTNLQALLRSKNWDGKTIKAGAAITVVSPGLVTRVQQLSSTFLAPTWDQKSYNVTLNAWNNSNFIGDAAVYMFTKPLVVQTTATTITGDQVMCITLQSSWDH
jgi:hypothetical protein